MSNSTNDKSTVVTGATIGKNQGTNQGFSGTPTGGSLRYQHGLPTEEEKASHNGPKLSQALATGGGKNRLTIRSDDSGNRTSEFVDVGVRQYDGKAGEVAEGVSAVTSKGHGVHNLNDLADTDLVRIGGLEMQAVDAAKAGLLERNHDGSYSATSEPQEATQDTPASASEAQPVVTQEAYAGVDHLSSLAGSDVSGQIVDVFLATAAGEEELSGELLDALQASVGNGMSRGKVVNTSQAVINSLVKSIRGVRPDGMQVAMERLDKLMERGQYHEARSTVLAIYNGDKRSLKKLLR